MIGVFASGFGGLTVHRALLLALAGGDFVYLAITRTLRMTHDHPWMCLT
jgi:glutamate racemase